MNQVLTNVPLSLPVTGNLLALADNKHSIIKLFDRNGRLEASLGNPDFKPISGIPHYPFRFGGIGIVALTEDGDLIVQNRIASKATETTEETDSVFKSYSGSFSTKGSTILPSFLVQISQKGVVKYLLGASGKNSEPFRYIEAVIPGEGDKLFVYHRIAEEMRLTYFDEGELKGNIRESLLPVFTSPEAKDFDITLDKMLPHPEGEYVLASFSYFSKKDKRFKYRKIFRYTFGGKDDIFVKEIQDPSEILFSIRNNNEFYIWETEDQGNSVRLQVHDQEGNHINNRRLPFAPPRGQWRETYTDSDDTIYSVRIRSGALEVYRWI
ncbi:putative lipoprotein [Leptospira ryugenii]|uniref:Putative lipoprotein n=1 Tax=Leptospira ryugenii TaxID=1917863 RepID=A0A2P2DXG6_9LEPT|nr:putative lipoprotein [Leptospira ryugenii]